MRTVSVGLRLATLVAAVCFIGSISRHAHAQDKFKGDFTHGGELRIRDVWQLNPTAKSNQQPTTDNRLSERLRLDLGFKASEKISANVTVLNNFSFGRPPNTSLNQPDGQTTDAQASQNAAAFSSANSLGDLLTVEQAYLQWMMSNNFVLKAGRINYQIGDGTLIGTNDWVAVPWAFEGALGTYEAEVGRLELFAFKFRELGNGPATSGYPTGSVTASDAERNAFGLNFDFKTLPEAIRAINVHVVNDVGDAVIGDNQNPGRGTIRYGAQAIFLLSIFDLKLWYEGLAGKLHYMASGSGADTSRDAEASMIQAELGATFENMMNTRVFFKWHMDTGNRNGSQTQSIYDPYFNEQHGSAGHMDLFGWGNLTFMELGMTIKPWDATDLGIALWKFSKTQSGSSASGPVLGPFGQILGRGVAANSDLGHEIDFWTERRFDGGISAMARASYFAPGNVYSGNTPAQNAGVAQIFVQGRLTF